MTDTVFLMVLALQPNKSKTKMDSVDIKVLSKVKRKIAYRWPNIRVDFVSASLKMDGEQQIMIVVRQFPPRESWSILVILLSLYGTWDFYGKK